MLKLKSNTCSNSTKSYTVASPEVVTQLYIRHYFVRLKLDAGGPHKELTS